MGTKLGPKSLPYIYIDLLGKQVAKVSLHSRCLSGYMSTPNALSSQILKKCDTRAGLGAPIQIALKDYIGAESNNN